MDSVADLGSTSSVIGFRLSWDAKFALDASADVSVDFFFACTTELEFCFGAAGTGIMGMCDECCCLFDSSVITIVAGGFFESEPSFCVVSFEVKLVVLSKSIILGSICISAKSFCVSSLSSFSSHKLSNMSLERALEDAPLFESLLR